MKVIYFLAISIFMTACAGTKPSAPFENSRQYPVTDYSLDQNWAALPSKSDFADLTPDPSIKDLQSEAMIDVFFLHPTSYTGQKGDSLWNAPVDNAEINARTNKGAIQNQASIFNGVGRVFAPYYRQAHIDVYYTNDVVSAKKALDVAYEDVRAAFQYYIEHHNNNRPFIIASHSQGTTHAIRLLTEEIENTNLRNRLVVAYLVGIPVRKSQFATILPCEKPYDTGCVCAWRTFEKSYVPKYKVDNMLVTNPLSWEINENYVSAAENKGAVYRKFKLQKTALVDAQIRGSILLVTKPHFPGSFLIRKKNYHVGDYNLFWMNVRENAKLREGAFWK
jgi:hypothetical protein